MPAAQLSAYTNMVYGERYFDYIAHELPEKSANRCQSPAAVKIHIFVDSSMEDTAP